MATKGSTSGASHPTPDQTLQQILAALQAIATAVDRGTDVLGGSGDERPASQEQSSTIVDYLVLRELVGRQADALRRTVAATRFSGQVVVFDGAIPADAVRVAVFTRRSAAPDEVTDILVSDGPIVDLLEKRGLSHDDPVFGFVLETVTDDQPIARLELRQAEDLTLALGPRLAAVA